MLEVVDQSERAMGIIGRIQLEVVSLRDFLKRGDRREETGRSLNALVLLAADLSEADGETKMKGFMLAEFSGKGSIKIRKKSKLKIDMESFFEKVDAELARRRAAPAESTPREEVPVVEIPVEGAEVAEKVGGVAGKIIG